MQNWFAILIQLEKKTNEKKLCHFVTNEMIQLSL